MVPKDITIMGELHEVLKYVLTCGKQYNVFSTNEIVGPIKFECKVWISVVAKHDCK
jgi:hypothetical protein